MLRVAQISTIAALMYLVLYGGIHEGLVQDFWLFLRYNIWDFFAVVATGILMVAFIGFSIRLMYTTKPPWED